MLTNKSGEVITINYSFKNVYESVVPKLESGYIFKEFIPFPEERMWVDLERGVVEAKLMPGETMLIDNPFDRVIERPDEYFNIESLKISSKSCVLDLTGPQVFAMFHPVEKSRFAFGPRYDRYVLEFTK